MHDIRVDITAQQGAGYDILVAQGVLAQAGTLMAKHLQGLSSVMIVSDDTVAPLYLDKLQASLTSAGLRVLPSFVVQAGEAAKNFETYQGLLSHALGNGIDRHGALVALGGGVVGDLTGYAAATLLRGIRFVQIPTTLLAQVDSAVGGKTGINTPQGKNLVGAFHQPALVLADTDVLKTLPAREMKAGYAEVLKYGLLGDLAFFEWLEKNAQAVLNGDALAIGEAVARSCRAKAAIVAQDPHEKNDLRALLNLGHTFGHALEALGGYDGRLLHGEAVAIGMRWAFAFSVAQGLCVANDFARVNDHMNATGLAEMPPFAVSAADILAAMRGDKKNVAGRMTLILVRAIGQAFVSRGVAEEEIQVFLKKHLKESN